MNKTITDYNNQNKRLLNSMKSEGMRNAIDFSSTSQRINAEKGFKKAVNGIIPSMDQLTRGFFRKII